MTSRLQVPAVAVGVVISYAWLEAYSTPKGTPCAVHSPKNPEKPVILVKKARKHAEFAGQAGASW